MKLEEHPKVEETKCSKCGKLIAWKIFYKDINGEKDFYYDELIPIKEKGENLFCEDCFPVETFKPF